MIISENITIVVASDNQYAVLTMALIKSMEINHHSKEILNFIIIDDGISNVNKNKLTESIEPTKTTISFRKSSAIIPAGIKIPIDDSKLPFIIYYRLFAPYVVDADCKKLIYMDVDMILYDDISKFYNTDLGDNIIGAVQDYQFVVSSPTAIPNYQQLGFKTDGKYFNAGLMLIDKDKWIENDITNKVIQSLSDNKQFVIYADQYGLNVVLHHYWQEIDLRWNCSDYFQEPDDPSLVHFLNIKPIFKSCFALQKHKDEFGRVLSMTKFADFKPKSDYHRLLKKGLTKFSKVISNTLSVN